MLKQLDRLLIINGPTIPLFELETKIIKHVFKINYLFSNAANLASNEDIVVFSTSNSDFKANVSSTYNFAEFICTAISISPAA